MINVTEHSSLPSLPTPFAKWLLLSSLCRMGTAPGFSPWKLVIPHCGTPCLAFNFPINNFSQHLFQHLFARARNCRGWCHDAHSDMGRCYQLVATLTLRGNTHTQIIPNPSLISHDNWKKTCLRIAMSQMEAELKFPHVQNSQSRGFAALTHAANCASNVCGQMADFLIPWLNLATLTLRGNTHTQIIPNPSQSSKHLISHDHWKKNLPSNHNESNGSRVEISARSKFAKSRLCSTYARCQLCQQRLRTDGRLLDTLTEHSSLWSMSLLSSPCRIKSTPGFSPWGLVMHQHLSARAGHCRGMTSQWVSKKDSWRSSKHKWMTWMRMILVRTCFILLCTVDRSDVLSLPANRNSLSGTRVDTKMQDLLRPQGANAKSVSIKSFDTTGSITYYVQALSNDLILVFYLI